MVSMIPCFAMCLCFNVNVLQAIVVFFDRNASVQPLLRPKLFFARLVLNVEDDESRLPCISGLVVFYGVE